MNGAYRPPLRYMGTKQAMRDDILRAILDDRRTPVNSVTDLFGGTGTVSGWLADGPAVTSVEAMAFPAVVARAVLLSDGAGTGEIERIADHAVSLMTAPLKEAEELVAAEDAAVGSPRPLTIGAIIEQAQHAGNGRHHEAIGARDSSSYALARLYFSRGYYSTRQAIALDALRQAIDELWPDPQGDFRRDYFLACWLSAASSMSNSPGHTAQFLRGRTEASALRVARAWSLDALVQFRRAVDRVRPAGTKEWRRGNTVIQSEAIETAARLQWTDGAVVYADPPYTKDHYSRMYHVLETLCLYDYPEALGVARSRGGGFRSDFSFRVKAGPAFERLLAATCGRGASIVLSYPAKGLLASSDLIDILGQWGVVSKVEIPYGHSTLGGRRGAGRVAVTECLYRVDVAHT